MKVSLTEAAAQRIKKQLQERGYGVGLRLGVKPSGCAQFAYRLEYVDQLGPDDQVFEHEGVLLVVSPDSLPYVKGTELDFVREGLNEGFKFNNPNVKEQCGCGESFLV